MSVRSWLRRRRAERTPLVWATAGNDEPADQNADLGGSYWGAIGPDGRPEFGAWSWEVRSNADVDGDSVAGGSADDEDAAKAAVETWRRTHRDLITARSETNPAPDGVEGD